MYAAEYVNTRDPGLPTLTYFNVYVSRPHDSRPYSLHPYGLHPYGLRLYGLRPYDSAYVVVDATTT